MTRRLYVAVGAAVIAGWSCNLDPHSLRDASPLRFAIWEGYFVDSPPPPQIVLLVSTETQYSCLGYRLENGFSVSGSVLHVTVSDRVTPPGEVCAGAIGPAGFRIALPVTIGTYTLEFTRLGVTDRYSVEITATTITVTTLEAQFTHPTASEFPRAS